jgi:hypothetical protein
MYSISKMQRTRCFPITKISQLIQLGRGAQVFQKSSSILKTQSAGRVTRKKIKIHPITGHEVPRMGVEVKMYSFFNRGTRNGG